MRTETKSIAPEVLLEEYRQLLREDPRAKELPLLISGGSMTPFLIGGRDTVFLSRVEGPVRRGDMLLYLRDGGGYVLHRVYRVTETGYTMLGDAQTVTEPGIRPDQVIARVTRVQRKGVVLQPGDFRWDFFAKTWIRIPSLRKFILGVYSVIRRKCR